MGPGPPTLARAHRIVTYDLRGHGSVSVTPLRDVADVLVDDLTRLLDRLDIASTHVVGHPSAGSSASSLLWPAPNAASPSPSRAADIIDREGIAGSEAMPVR